MSVKYFISLCHSGAGPHDDTTSLKLRSAGVFIFSACACVLNFTTLKTEIDGVEKNIIHTGGKDAFSENIFQILYHYNTMYHIYDCGVGGGYWNYNR